MCMKLFQNQLRIKHNITPHMAHCSDTCQYDCTPGESRYWMVWHKLLSIASSTYCHDRWATDQTDRRSTCSYMSSWLPFVPLLWNEGANGDSAGPLAATWYAYLTSVARNVSLPSMVSSGMCKSRLCWSCNCEKLKHVVGRKCMDCLRVAVLHWQNQLIWLTRISRMTKKSAMRTKCTNLSVFTCEACRPCHQFEKLAKTPAEAPDGCGCSLEKFEGACNIR